MGLSNLSGLGGGALRLHANWHFAMKLAHHCTESARRRHIRRIGIRVPWCCCRSRRAIQAIRPGRSSKPCRTRRDSLVGMGTEQLKRRSNEKCLALLPWVFAFADRRGSLTGSADLAQAWDVRLKALRQLAGANELVAIKGNNKLRFPIELVRPVATRSASASARQALRQSSRCCSC